MNLHPLMGGILIGAAASLFLICNGRVLGVSGIVSGILLPRPNDLAWRLTMISGLVSAGILMQTLLTRTTANSSHDSLWRYLAAGVLVGIGTQLGSGCTSGHGVCGISRLSKRSIIATLTFMLVAMLTVFFLKFIKTS